MGTYHAAARGTASRPCTGSCQGPIRPPKPPGPPWLIILNLLGLSSGRGPLIHWCIMRFPSALLACFSLLAATAASADSRVFIIANQADGYGVDQCLAQGKNAAPTPPAPTASRGISPRRCRTGASIPMKSPGPFPRPPAATATMPAATNTSPSPASADAVLPRQGVGLTSATPAPRKRRDAAPRSGYVGPRRPRFSACHRFNGWIWLKR